MEALIVIIILLIVGSVLAHLLHSLDLFVYIIGVMTLMMALIAFAWLQLYFVGLMLLLGSGAMGGFFFFYRYIRHL